MQGCRVPRSHLTNRQNLTRKLLVSQCLPEIPLNGHGVPGRLVVVLRNRLQPGPFPDGLMDLPGCQDGAVSRPVGILLAEKRPVPVKTILQEEQGQIENGNAFLPQQPIKLLCCGVDSHRRFFPGNRQCLGEEIGIDDAFGRNGHHQQLDAHLLQLPVKIDDRRERICEFWFGCLADLGRRLPPEGSCRHETELRAKEKPPLFTRNSHVCTLFRRFGHRGILIDHPADSVHLRRKRGHDHRQKADQRQDWKYTFSAHSL